MSMRTPTLPVLTAALALVLAAAPHAQQAASTSKSPGKFSAPRTPWGDPDLQGSFSNKDENGTPFERPDELAGKSLSDFGEKEMAALRKARQARAQAGAGRIGGSEEEDTGAGPSHWYEHLNANNAQPWLVFEPADGRIPPTTKESRDRAAARQAARKGRGPADSWIDRSLYDRCITRGIPGSMMPAIYGNSYRLHQGPGFVTITYEMVGDTRVIPLDGRPHLPGKFRHYMGDGRGRWEGNTLVIETTNFTDKTPYRGSSDGLTLVERFTPLGPDTVEWAVTLDDPRTWARPWTFAMNLTRDPSQPPFEYACHEGNYGLRNILAAARAEERATAAAGAAGK